MQVSQETNGATAISVASDDTTLAATAEALDGGHIDRTIATYRPLVAHSGGDELSALVGLAVRHARRKEWEEAEACLLRVLKRVPDSGKVRAYLASVRLEMGHLEEARSDMNAALEMAPSSALVRLKHAETLLRQGALSEAYAELQRAAKLPSPDATALTYIHELLASTKTTLDQTIGQLSPAPTSLWRTLVARFRGSRPAVAS